MSFVGVYVHKNEFYFVVVSVVVVVLENNQKRRVVVLVEFICLFILLHKMNANKKYVRTGL